MFSKLCRGLALLLVISIVGVSADAAKAKKKAQTIGDLSEEIMGSLQAFYPVHATEMGIHTYDKHLADYSAKSVKQMISTLKGYQGRLKKFEKTEMTPEQRIDWKLIQSNVEV